VTARYAGAKLGTNNVSFEAMGALIHGFSLVAKNPAPHHVSALSRVVPHGTWIYLSADPMRPLDEESQGSSDLKMLGFEPVPHLAVRMVSDTDALQKFVVRLAGIGVRKMFVIAGDCSQAAGKIQNSIEVINSGILRRHGIVEVGIAGYPDGHPSLSEQELDRILVQKIVAAERSGLVVHIATQFCFSAETIIKWLHKLRDRGIGNAVRIGLPGPADVAILTRYARSCGVPHAAEPLPNSGAWSPREIIRVLAEANATRILGDVRLSFFSFGGLTATARWVASMEAPC
jgi:methylenetetrahydrofolate reductase (NADPH)